MHHPRSARRRLALLVGGLSLALTGPLVQLSHVSNGWAASHEPRQKRLRPRWRPSRDLRELHLGRQRTTDLARRRHVALVDPTTGKVDAKTRIIELGVDQDTRTAVAIVRHHSGHERPVAADRLRLIGQGLGVQRRYLRHLNRTTQKQIERALGVRVAIAVRTERPDRFARGHDEFAGHDPSDYGGYQHEGRVYLERDWHAFVPVVRVHEAMHAAASRDIDSSLYVELKEGLAHHLTELVCKRSGIAFTHVDGYTDGPTRFVARLARLIGERQLTKIYTRGSLDDLRRAVDAKTRRGTFDRATDALEEQRYDEATKRLGKTRRRKR